MMLNIFNLIYKPIKMFWEWLKSFFNFLLPIRASIISILILYLFFKVNEQGEDILRVLSEDITTKINSQIVLFFVTLFMLSLSVWYLARVMLNFKFPATKSRDFIFEYTLRKYLPRFLGVSVYLIILYSLKDIKNNNTLISITITLAVLFYLFVHFRRVFLLKMQRGIKEANSYKQQLTEFDYLPKSSKIMALSILIFTILLFILFTLSIKSTTFFGTSAILVCAAIGWVGIGAMLIYLGMKNSFPIITILLVLAVIFSNYNNNHTIRDIASSQYKNRESLIDAFKKKTQNFKNKPYFLVTADGGGIRAAYWSAMVLSALESKNSNFSKHIFAISSVSGGSLGSAIFTSLVANKSFCNDKKRQKFGKLATCSDEILKKDYLSYPTAYMLFPDLAQRFLPISIEALDRGRALEEGWEIGFKEVTKNNTLNENFFNIFNKDTPYLFFNSTWVEGGKRVIMSNVEINSTQFPDAIDFFRVFKRDSYLSSMVHNSARFTYVSPAGNVLNKEHNRSWGHIVDGGYFENSGATTALDILNSVSNIKNTNLTPVVITLTNDPSLKKPCNPYKERSCKSINFMNETLSPIRAILKSRGARGSNAKEELKRFVKLKGGIFIEFAICPSKEPPPLGWVLSDNSRVNMQKELEKYFKIYQKNYGNFNPLSIEDLRKMERLTKDFCKKN